MLGLQTLRMTLIGRGILCLNFCNGVVPGHIVEWGIVQTFIQGCEGVLEVTYHAQFAFREHFANLVGIDIEVNQPLGIRRKLIYITGNPVVVA